MKVNVLTEEGISHALYGIALSYNLMDMYSPSAFRDIYNQYRENKDLLHSADLNNVEKILNLAKKLAFKTGGENKFLRQCIIWLDVQAPRLFWTQFDTYKVGTVAQSESTMHTILRKPFDMDMFEIYNMYNSSMEVTYLASIIDKLNHIRDICLKTEDKVEAKRYWRTIIDLLPQSWLQRRIVTMNYAVLQNIYPHRINHKLYEWKMFIETILESISHPEFIVKKDESKVC